MKLHLAYHKEKAQIAVGREIVEVKAFQLMVWISITNSKLQTLIYGDQTRAVIQTPRKWYWPL